MKFLAQNTALVLGSAPPTWWIHIAIGPSGGVVFGFQLGYFFFNFYFILEYWQLTMLC